MAHLIHPGNALNLNKMLKVYYNIDGGMTKFTEIKIPAGTTIYHSDTQDCLRMMLVHELYKLLSNGGSKDVGKIFIVHASF